MSNVAKEKRWLWIWKWRWEGQGSAVTAWESPAVKRRKKKVLRELCACRLRTSRLYQNIARAQNYTLNFGVWVLVMVMVIGISWFKSIFNKKSSWKKLLIAEERFLSTQSFYKGRYRAIYGSYPCLILFYLLTLELKREHWILHDEDSEIGCW